MVITKGATRITEVQARFVLDAMPNKMMAIDAEFNSGAITEEVATLRKAELQKEIGTLLGADFCITLRTGRGFFFMRIRECSFQKWAASLLLPRCHIPLWK